jgi:shikimate dehydrogenase
MYRLVTGLAGAHAQSSFLPDALDLLCRDAGLNISFEICDTASDTNFDLSAAIEDRARRGWTGISISDPYEIAAARTLADELSPEAERTGAANVLIFGTPVKGHNTNYTGFLNCWRTIAGDSGPGAVALAGAGGLGRAIASALNDLGATDIAIFDDSFELAEETSKLIGGVCRAVKPGEWQAVTRNADGLVNTTTRGMGHNLDMPFIESAIFGQHWAFDAVYRPVNTRFIRLARESGIYCISGFDMLLHTAVATFASLTGMAPDHELALKSLSVLQRSAA